MLKSRHLILPSVWVSLHLVIGSTVIAAGVSFYINQRIVTDVGALKNVVPVVSPSITVANHEVPTSNTNPDLENSLEHSLKNLPRFSEAHEAAQLFSALVTEHGASLVRLEFVEGEQESVGLLRQTESTANVEGSYRPVVRALNFFLSQHNSVTVASLSIRRNDTEARIEARVRFKSWFLPPERTEDSEIPPSIESRKVGLK